jgi:hypothetical protein
LGSATQLTFDRDPAAGVHLDDLFRDGQSEPGAAARWGVLGALEAVEDVRHVVGGDADAWMPMSNKIRCGWWTRTTDSASSPVAAVATS